MSIRATKRKCIILLAIVFVPFLITIVVKSTNYYYLNIIFKRKQTVFAEEILYDREVSWNWRNLTDQEVSKY